MLIEIDLPKTNFCGLSERWIFGFCGDLHWRSLLESYGVSNLKDLYDKNGELIYPTFIGVRARYQEPLNKVQLGDRFEAKINLSCFGRWILANNICLESSNQKIELEMLTAFAAKDTENEGRLRLSLPHSKFRSSAPQLSSPPEIFQLSKQVRRENLASFSIAGFTFAENKSTVCHWECTYEPSPYVEFNGVGLLYFASYPALVDELERELIHAHVPGLKNDWAKTSSTIARDVFYHGNIAMGARLYCQIISLQADGDQIGIHTRLFQAGGAPVADILTVKLLKECDALVQFLCPSDQAASCRTVELPQSTGIR